MKQIIVKYSLLSGAASAGYALLFYTFNKPLYVGSFWFTLGLWVLYAVLFYIAGKEAQRGGLSGRTALRALFAAFTLGAIIYFAFEYYLYHSDTGLVDMQKESMVEMYLRSGNSPKDMNEMREAIMGGDYHTVSSTLFSLAQRLIGGFILCFGVQYLISSRAER